jgi:DNA modification methylase
MAKVSIKLLSGDCCKMMQTLEAASIHCCVTSPPYWGLRDYGVEGQIGLEETPEEYVGKLVGVFREVKRVLRDDGTLWLNLGDSYAGDKSGGRNDTPKMYGAESQHLAAKGRLKTSTSGLKPKDLVGIPWRVAFALQADGWYLRSDIIWHKPNPMPESVTDRPTKAHEYVFLLSKKERYYYDADAIREKPVTKGLPTAESMRGKGFHDHKKDLKEGQRFDGKSTHRKAVPEAGRNKRSVWTVATKPYSEAHFATFPPKLITPCVLAGCPKGGTVLDPFGGAGTTGLVADGLGRDAVLIELNEEYADMAHQRIYQSAPLFAEVETYPNGGN